MLCNNCCIFDDLIFPSQIQWNMTSIINKPVTCHAGTPRINRLLTVVSLLCHECHYVNNSLTSEPSCDARTYNCNLELFFRDITLTDVFRASQAMRQWYAHMCLHFMPFSCAFVNAHDAQIRRYLAANCGEDKCNCETVWF